LNNYILVEQRFPTNRQHIRAEWRLGFTAGLLRATKRRNALTMRSVIATATHAMSQFGVNCTFAWCPIPNWNWRKQIMDVSPPCKS